MAPAPAATATTATSVGGSPCHGVLRRLGLMVCGGYGLWKDGVRRLGFVEGRCAAARVCGDTLVCERPFLYTEGAGTREQARGSFSSRRIPYLCREPE